MIDEAYLRQWIGRQDERSDTVSAGVVDRLAALLDHQAPPWIPGELPPLGHWLVHLSDARQGLLGTDGHPERGGFLPPVPLPRRMWAGSRIRFDGAIPIGAEIVRRSTIADVVVKRATGAEKVFVTVRHEIAHDGAVRIVDEHDIVYVGDRSRLDAVATPLPFARAADTARSMVADPVLLFRYSALTFNGHRIHYDRDYATGTEGYPGLVVHGPLLATLLVDHYLRAHPGSRIKRFAFRARAPLFDGEPFDLCLANTIDGADLWTFEPHRGATIGATIAL